jgi:4-methylaminobutanoate oxidase (formaldehyde-forming)
MGEAPGLRGFFVGAGFNSVGIASAGGAGRALAEWVVAGEPTSDLVAVDVRRFAPYAGDHAWLRERVVETLGLHYAVPWPDREPETGRDVRLSPLHSRLAAKGAVFGTKMGWERVNVLGGRPGAPSWGRPWWLEASSAEHVACRTAVAVFDQTSFSTYDVTGPDAVAALQWVCAAEVDVPVGQCVYTPLLNARGTYEADLTVTRTGPDSFLLVSSSATTVRDLDWIRRHAADRDVRVDDVTDEQAVLGVMGPRARELMARLDPLTDWSDDAFPFATSRQVVVEDSFVRATRMTYVGELGWELMMPMAAAGAVYDALHEAGADLGLRDAGYHAIESLRLEKGYRAFPRELNPDLTPVEAGLLFATALGARAASDKDFLGRAALTAHRAQLAGGGPRRRIVSLVLEDPAPMLWGGELVLRDGAPAGQVTSAAYGATVGAAVGLALLRSEGPVRQEDLDASAFEIDVAGDRYAARITLTAPLR